MTEKKTKWTLYRLSYHRSGIVYSPLYRKKLETVERLAREKLCHEDYFTPCKATIEVCHETRPRGSKNWQLVKTITKEESRWDAARSSG